MARSSLDNTIRVLLGRGKSINDIYKSIKSNPKTKGTNNRYIEAAVKRVQASYKAGQAFGGSKGSATIGGIAGKAGGRSTGSKTVTYTFTLNGKLRTNSKPGVKGSGLESLEVPSTATKAEVLAAVRERILEWLQEHYEIDNLGGIGSNIRIKSIEDN